MPNYSTNTSGAVISKTFGSDTISNIEHPFTKLEYGPAGTATVVTDDNPLPVNVRLTNLPALAPTTDRIGAVLASDLVSVGTTTVAPKYAVINRSSTGNGTAVVAAVTAKKIRVLRFSFVHAGAVTVKWQSGTTDISGPMVFDAAGGMVEPFSPYGSFETAAGVALNLNLSATVQVGGTLQYVEI